MRKIYEALQQAHQQKKASGKNLEVIIPQNLLNRNQVEMGEEMLSLFKVIDNRLPELRHRVLLFIGSRPGEGTSTVVREFARVAAERVGQKVLLVMRTGSKVPSQSSIQSNHKLVGPRLSRNPQR